MSKEAASSLFALILMAFITLPAAAAWAELSEEAYCALRDGAIQQFEKGAEPGDESRILAVLEKELQVVIGPVRVEGFPVQGAINLVTLFGDNAGFDQLDGLRYDSGAETLVVTTESLLMRYTTDHPILPHTLRKLSEIGDFYRRVFHADAGVVLYAEIPVAKRKSQSFARAFLGVSAQDVVPFIPNELFVFVSAGSHVLFVNAPAATKITDIERCRKEWDVWKKKSTEAYEVYRSSQMKNTKAYDDSRRYAVEGLDAYCRCFEREAKNQAFFLSLAKQAQSIVDRLKR